MTDKTETTGASERPVRFVREFHRYWVLKMVDLMAALTPEEMDTLIRLSDKVDEYRGRAGKQPFMCVVVEADWPEYEPTWKAIEARMTAKAGGQVERVVRHPITCDQVAWLLDVFARYLPQDGRPRVSRHREMLKYGMLYEVMEVAGLSFADDAARWNGTPQDARKHELE